MATLQNRASQPAPGRLLASRRPESSPSTQEHETVPVPTNQSGDLSSVASLRRIGYSPENSHNSVGILTRLDTNVYEPRPPPTSHCHDCTSACFPFPSLDASARYRHLVQAMPCHLCTRILVDHFFDHVDSHYGLLDRDVFADLHSQSILRTRRLIDGDLGHRCNDAELLVFPALVYQVLSNGLQALQGDFNPHPEPLCLARPATASSAACKKSSDEIMSLLPRYSSSLSYVLTLFVGMFWFLDQGKPRDSARMLAQASRVSQRLCLLGDRGPRGDPLTKSWGISMKRRTMLNLFIWDRYG